MASEEVVEAGESTPLLTSPWPLLLAGLGIAALTFAVSLFDLGSGWTAFRVLLLIAAALATGGAVVVRPQSPPLLAAAAGVSGLLGAGLDRDWDTARLVMFVLAGVALVAAFLLGLPYLISRLFLLYAFLVPSPTRGSAAEVEERGRFVGWVLSRVLVSVLVVLHFVGIIAQALAAPVPSGRESSWLAQWLAAEGQPYLQFTYLTNSYRFYSPEPAPADLLWFYVQYSDGTGAWVKVPDRATDAKDPLGQEFTRRLSLGMSVSQALPLSSIPESVLQPRLRATLHFNRLREYEDESLDNAMRRQRLTFRQALDLRRPGLLEVLDSRPFDAVTKAELRARIQVMQTAEEWKDTLKILFVSLPIPLNPDYPLMAQYQVPRVNCQRNLTEYTRFVAAHYPSAKPNVTVTGVKAYRVMHKMLEPKLLATGRFKPDEPWTFLPYYLGEYDTEGRLTDSDNPLLYWLIPRYSWPEGQPLPPGNLPLGAQQPLERFERLDLLDYLELQAQQRRGQAPEGRQP